MRLGLFDWLFRKRARTPWIAKEDFVEDLNESEQNTENANNIENTNNNIMDLTSNVNEMQHQDLILQGRKEIDDFLIRDFEPQGYKDALINPDTTNAASNKEILKYQLELKIERALTVYENKIKDYDFHIKTRAQNGLMDTVDEIQAEKDKILEEVKKIEMLLSEARENKGKGHIIILSYEQGFKRGLAAITAAKLFGKNLSNE